VADTVVTVQRASLGVSVTELTFDNPDPNLYDQVELWIKQGAWVSDINWRISKLNLGTGVLTDPFGTGFTYGGSTNNASQIKLFIAWGTQRASGLQNDSTYVKGIIIPCAAPTSISVIQQNDSSSGTFSGTARWRSSILAARA